jgi:hypothetical protein
MLPSTPPFDRAVPAALRAVLRAVPRLSSLGAIVCLALACSQEPVAPPIQLAEDAEPLTDWALPGAVGEPAILSVPTYEGTGQSVHPDMVVFPDAWNGARYWMAMTPYPGGNAMFENPSILNSADGLELAIPPGVKNPIVKPINQPDYNSDPDLVYDVVRHELVLSYRVVKDGRNTIKIITSGDGVRWSDARVAFSEKNHSAISQSIVLPAHAPATAWYVDAGSRGCSALTTRVMTRRSSGTAASIAQSDWGPAVETDMAVPGYNVWHLKVRYVPSKHEYWALIVAYPQDGRGCGADDLFLGQSRDGVRWTVLPRPLMRHEERPWTEGALYRGTFAYDASVDQIAIWFSARGKDERWQLGFVRLDYSDLAARLAQPPASRATMPNASRPIWTSAP